MSAVGVGIIGVGVISDTYLENLNSFPDVEVLVVGDLIADRARSQAEKHGIPAHGSGPDVLAHPGVELVVNLTTPDAHIEVTSAAIAAGKHVWSEKPLGLDRDGAAALLEQAKAAGVRIGAAPDTLLGPGFQSARRAIASGVIGEPMFAQTAFQTQGPDLWHPNPGFLFAQGAGPLLDMGPYYFSALISLLGPVDRVAAVGRKAREQREIRTGPNAGSLFPVEVPSTIQVLTAFEGGAQGQSLLSFDSAQERHGILEIHGTEGSIVLPDPNQFTGTDRVRQAARRAARRHVVRAVVGRGRGEGHGRRPRPGRAGHGAFHRGGPAPRGFRRAGQPQRRRDAVGAGVRRHGAVRQGRQHGRTGAAAARRLRSLRCDPVTS